VSNRGSIDTPRMSPGVSPKNSLGVDEEKDLEEITVELNALPSEANNRRSFRFVKALVKN
jgi:hypothetical protein